MMLSLIIFCFLFATAQTINLGSIHVEGYGEVWVHSWEATMSEAFVHDNGFTKRGMNSVYFGTGPESPSEVSLFGVQVEGWIHSLGKRIFSA